MRFYIKCNPPKSTAQGSTKIMKHKSGKMFIGKASNSKGSIARNELIALLTPHVPEKPFTRPLLVHVDWVYPWRKTEKKVFKEIGHRCCDKRPDCDNLMKLLFDCMTRLGFWSDDSIVFDVRFIKLWGNDPGITISIVEVLQNGQ